MGIINHVQYVDVVTDTHGSQLINKHYENEWTKFSTWIFILNTHATRIFIL